MKSTNGKMPCDFEIVGEWDKDVKLIRWQGYERSHWLRRYPADFYGVEFYEWYEE